MFAAAEELHAHRMFIARHHLRDVELAVRGLREDALSHCRRSGKVHSFTQGALDRRATQTDRFTSADNCLELGLHRVGGTCPTLQLHGAGQDIVKFFVTQSHRAPRFRQRVRCGPLCRRNVVTHSSPARAVGRAGHDGIGTVTLAPGSG
jgi:hypothetical protein